MLLCQDFSFEDIFCRVSVSFFLRDLLLLLLSSLSDMLFLQGSEVIFKVALSLLGSHKPLILQHESLESIVDFIKTMLPKLGLVQMEKTINQVRKTRCEDSIVSSFPLSGRADWNYKRKSCFSSLRLID